MIKVDRASQGAPIVLTGSNSRGVKETKRICGYYTLQAAVPPVANASKMIRPKHVVYSDEEVKKVLTSLFGGKCAYCEGRYASTQPMDVEHYRPKAGVNGEPHHPGYYWLGATWENLLPSCIDCNREREQIPLQVGGFQPPPVKTGKDTKFPLLNSAQRVSAPSGNIALESPVLLNPCEDEPHKFLLFTKDGVVKSAITDGSPEQLRADGTIEILGLNRPGLVQARLETLRLLEAHMLIIDRLVKIIEAQGLKKTTADLVEDLLAHEFSVLKSFSETSRPYSEMCKQRVAEFMEKFKP